VRVSILEIDKWSENPTGVEKKFETLASFQGLEERENLKTTDFPDSADESRGEWRRFTGPSSLLSFLLNSRREDP
jgi:hypothetical protein